MSTALELWHTCNSEVLSQSDSETCLAFISRVESRYQTFTVEWLELNSFSRMFFISSSSTTRLLGNLENLI